MLWTSYRSLPLTPSPQLKKHEKNHSICIYVPSSLSLTLGTHKVFFFISVLLFSVQQKNYFNSNTLWHFFLFLYTARSRQLENLMIIENVQKKIYISKWERENLLVLQAFKRKRRVFKSAAAYFIIQLCVLSLWSVNQNVQIKFHLTTI